jgi:hypothetical protein
MNVRSIEGYKKEGQLQRLVKDMRQDIWFLTETKLTRNIRFDGYLVQQTMGGHKGGCVTLVREQAVHQMRLVKTLGSYMNWTKVRLTNDTCWIHLISCYLEGGEQTYQKQRAERVAEVINDIIRQDKLATIIIGGDFNNHLPLMKHQLRPHNFEQAIMDGE